MPHRPVGSTLHCCVVLFHACLLIHVAVRNMLLMRIDRAPAAQPTAVALAHLLLVEGICSASLSMLACLTAGCTIVLWSACLDCWVHFAAWLLDEYVAYGLTALHRIFAAYFLRWLFEHLLLT